MSSLFRTVVCCLLVGVLPAQGFSYDSAWLPAPIGTPLRAEFVDMNGDGYLDLVRMYEQQIDVLIQDAATGRYTRTDSLVFGSGSPALRDFAIGELDGSSNGVPDLAVVWSTGEVGVLMGSANGAFVQLMPSPVPGMLPASGRGILAADLNGDGRDDILVLLEGLPPQYLRAQSGGMFINDTATAMPAIGYSRPVGTLADIEGDGDLDLVLCSINSLPPRLFENQNGTFVDVPNAFGSTGISTSSVLAIDITGSQLPEIVFGRSGTANRPPVVRINNAGTFPTQTLLQTLQLKGVLDMAALDVNDDGSDDIAFLESDGSLGYAFRGVAGVLAGQTVGSGSISTEPFPLLAAHSQRLCIAGGDLEGDGDVDLFAGGGCADSLLLHGMGSDFHDTERLSFATSEMSGNVAGVLVDRNGDGNADFVGLYPGGEWVGFDNDGSGYYTSITSQALPVLPGTTIWDEVIAMSLAGPGSRDLLAFGVATSSGPQIATLVNANGSWTDETATRFGGAVTGLIAAVATYSGDGGEDDLVIGTFTGELEFHENVGGTLVPVGGVFPSGLQLWNLSRLIVADFSDDGVPDVMALSTGGAPPKLLVASGGGTFVEQPIAFPIGVSGDQGIAADLDADGDTDVLLRTTGMAGVTALTGSAGSFSVVSLGQLGTVSYVIDDFEVVDVDGEPQVVMVRNGERDLVMAWNGTNYPGASLLPYRGSTASTGVIAGDLDRDGDDDLIVLRDGVNPLVLNNETLHLQPLGSTYGGRTAEVLLRGPSVGALAFIAWGLPLDSMTPWGLLRLNPATMGSMYLGPAPASRENVWSLPLAPGLPSIRFPLQAAWITQGGDIVLSGLEHLVVAQ